MSLERITKVRLPYDRRSPDPKTNYGIHGLDIFFILKGPRGAIQFAVTFPQYLPHVQAEFDARADRPRSFDRIMGFDVGYHALEPQYEGQSSMGSCDLFPHLESGCFYDGSSLRADDWVKEIFSIRGENPENRLWEKLEHEYEARFGATKAGA